MRQSTDVNILSILLSCHKTETMANRRSHLGIAVAAVTLLLGGDPLRSWGAEGARTAILCAFSEEIDHIEGMLSDSKDHTVMGMRFMSGKLNGRPVVVATSGAGKVNAAMVATLLIDRFSPAELLFTGMAGAIDSDLRPGDLVVGEKTAQHDLGDLTPEGIQLRGMRNPIDWQRNPVYIEGDSRLLAVADSAAGHVEFPRITVRGEDRVPRVVRGTIVTGDVFVSSSVRKEELRREMHASAVDMEGGAVAQICRQFGVPCLVIRSISDTADAGARQQAGMFLAAAARNSAEFVAEIVRRLAAGNR